MNKIELNIYGENDEIVKTYKTSVIRWKLFTDAIEINDTLNGKSLKAQIESVSEFIKSVFVGLTDEELACADAFDIMNVFKQIVIKAQNINGSKNA